MANSSVVSVVVAPLLTPTTVTFSLPNGTSYYYAQTILLQAVLKDSSGKALSGKTIVFEAMPPPFTVYGDLTPSIVTDVNGTAQLNMTGLGPYPSPIGFNARFDGDVSYSNSGGTNINATIVQMPTALSITVSPTSGKAPLAVVITGQLTQARQAGIVPGVTVSLLVNGSSVTSAVTDINGNYTMSTTLPTAGTYTLQTTFAGNTDFSGCEKAGTVLADGLLTPSVPWVAIGVGAVIAVSVIGYFALRK